MKELLIKAKSLGGGGSEVAMIELINTLPDDKYHVPLVLLDGDDEYSYAHLRANEKIQKVSRRIRIIANPTFARLTARVRFQYHWDCMG